MLGKFMPTNYTDRRRLVYESKWWTKLTRIVLDAKNIKYDTRDYDAEELHDKNDNNSLVLHDNGRNNFKYCNTSKGFGRFEIHYKVLTPSENTALPDYVNTAH